jgi:uncharacterized repeat protein (TIGR04076 family)
LIEKTSTAGDVNCLLPPLSSVYSNENFGIEVESEGLNSGVYFGTASDKSYSKAFNLINTDQVKDSKNVKCTVGMEFKFRNTGADGNNIITISPNAADAIHGTVAAIQSGGVANKDWINTKATANKGDWCSLVAIEAGSWYLTGGDGVWASES